MLRVVAGLVCVACGGSGVGRPVAEFPSRDDIESVMMSKAAEPKADLKTVDVASWQLKSSIPAPGSAYPAETAWDRYLAGRVAGGKGKLSAALRCAGNETARFYLEAGGFPDDGTRRYLAERCGSTLPSFRFGWVEGKVPDDVPDERIATEYQKSLDELVAQNHIGGTTEVGLGVSRAKGRVALVLYSGTPEAELTAFNPVVEGNSVTLSGKVSADAAYALALVNQGESGVTTCEPDRRLKLPSFSVTCPFATDEAQTRIEIAIRKPGRVLMDVQVSALVRHTEEAGLSYEPVTRGTDATAADANAFRTALFGLLNDARRSANAPALELEPKQSQVNERLAPHLFQASMQGDSALADTIGLGVLAGWDVNGVIRDGGIHWGSVTSTRSPARYLSYALESPFARFIMLDPSMSRVAIGAAALPPSGAMALVTTYAFFQSQDHKADEDKVFAELVKRRQARRHGAPKRVAREVALDTALARVSTNALTTNDALEEAMTRVVATEQRGVSGFIAETSDLKQIPWPDSLLDRDPLEVEVGVAHYKAKGGAWGQYAVIFLIREPSSLKTAARPAAHRL